jgi:hypothetical protein
MTSLFGFHANHFNINLFLKKAGILPIQARDNGRPLKPKLEF